MLATSMRSTRTFGMLGNDGRERLGHAVAAVGRDDRPAFRGVLLDELEAEPRVRARDQHRVGGGRRRDGQRAAHESAATQRERRASLHRESPRGVVALYGTAGARLAAADVRSRIVRATAASSSERAAERERRRAATGGRSGGEQQPRAPRCAAEHRAEPATPNVGHKNSACSKATPSADQREPGRARRHLQEREQRQQRGRDCRERRQERCACAA